MYWFLICLCRITIEETIKLEIRETADKVNNKRQTDRERIMEKRKKEGTGNERMILQTEIGNHFQNWSHSKQ